MDKVYCILWLMQILVTVHVTGRFAVNAKHAGKISYTTHKPKAPEKMWTSRSWWREVPGQNEPKLYATSSKHFGAAKKQQETKSNMYQKFQQDGNIVPKEKFLESPIN